MDIVNALLLILGGIVALSGIIVMKRPDLKPQLDKLAPFQALIGVGLIALGLINFLRSLGWLTETFKVNQIFAAAVWIMLLDSVLLGALLGWPLIASWIPDHSPAKPKVQQITQNLAPFQVLLGIVGIAAAVVYLLFRFKILSMTGYFGGNS
jgi:hypothetical protein